MERSTDPQGEPRADVVIVGSGAGGLCSALAAADQGLDVIVVEKRATIGGATAISGGVIWIPCNPLLAQNGIADSPEFARSYLDSLIGGAGGAASPERRAAFLEAGPEMIRFVQAKGLQLQRCNRYTDYFPENPGALPVGRGLESKVFDARRLGAAEELLPPRAGAGLLPIQAVDVPYLSLMGRTLSGAGRATQVASRLASGYSRRRHPVASGAALTAQLLLLCLGAGVRIVTEATLEELVVDGDRVVGIETRRGDRPVRIMARRGVILAAGGFARSRAMREAHGPAPASAEWTSVPEGDTGDAIAAAERIGAASEGLDDAWWVPSTVLPNGSPQLLIAERSKPHCLVVDGDARRYLNEAAPYVSVGQAMYAHQTRAEAVPSWFIMDSRHRRRYAWGATLPGWTPRDWLRSGYFRTGESIPELAAACDLDPVALAATVERFNGFAATGKDEDFHKGESVYDRYYGDPRSRPNPCLGAIARPPFYAVRMVPGDVGTAGGLLTDTDARVLRDDGTPIPGLYGTGNTTASVMAHTYPGPGATIGPAMTWGFLAARHLGESEGGRR